MSETREENSRVASSVEASASFNYRENTFDVYVGRIPGDWTKEKMLEIFTPFGEIKSLELKGGPEYFNGNQIAFVRYSNQENAKAAVDSLMGYRVENGTLQINMAQRTKKDRQGSLDFSQPRKTYAELKRVNYQGQGELKRPNQGEIKRTNYQGEFRRGPRVRRNEPDHAYGGGYAPTSYTQKKDGNSSTERQRSHEDLVILVTEVESPVRFWGQVAKATVAHNLSTASEELQQYCPTGLKVADGSHQKNKIYGGMYPVDNLWYRCSVVKFLPQSMVTVRYIDFGNTDTIKKDTLVELPPSLTDGRPFAQLYFLSDCAVSTDPQANEMTYALGIEQLKNLVIGKLVTVKFVSENANGGFYVTVSYPGDSGKSINEIMLTGGCVQKIKSRNDKGRIEKSVAEKPLNENHEGSSAGSPQRDDRTSLNQKLENLKLTLKFQSETICNLNRLFETVKQQNDDLCLELDQAIKMKTILTAVTDLHQSRSRTACGQDKTSNIDFAISLVTGSENRITLNQVDSFEKLSVSSDAFKQAQDSLKTLEDKEKIKELVEHRNRTRQELLGNIKNFLDEVTLLNINERGQKLEEAIKKLSIFHQRYDGNDLSVEEAVKNYKDWKGKPLQNDVNSLRQVTDDISRKLAREFMNLVKMLDPDDDMTLEDCGTVDINSVAKQFSEAVAAEAEQNQGSEDAEGIQIVAALIKCLKKELQDEVSDVRQLRSRAEECTKVQGDLETFLDQEFDVTKILDVRKNLKSVKSKFRHKLADKKDLEEGDEAVDEEELQQVENDLVDLRLELHRLLVEEKSALGEIAANAVENFPEILVQYPEFGLQKFITSNGLVKQGWELTYYSHGEMEKVMTSSQGEVAFATMFNGEKCLLKEFYLEDIPDIDSFEAQAVAFSRVTHPNLVKVKALFYDKTHRKAFIQLPYYETSLKKWLEDKPSDKAKRDVICDVIRALCALHQAGITHGSVVMDNIYVDENNKGILGEYCFIYDTQQRVATTAELLLQNSTPVSCDTSPVFDMVGLGEISWVVFLGDEALPRDLTSLQKHTQSKAVSFMLTFLFAFNGGARPTANQLAKHPFFTDDDYFEIDKTCGGQVTPQETLEKSLPEENIPPTENSLQDEKTLPEENMLPEENILPTENSLPDEKNLPEENTLPAKNTQSEDAPREENIVPPEEITLSAEITHSEENTVSEVSTQSEVKTQNGAAVPDEIPPVEEALPVEYAVTQRKPLLDENGLKATVEVTGTPEENSTENIEHGNTSESCQQDVDGTQGQ